MAFIEGRADDVLYTGDGRRVGRLDPVFKANLPIREAQIIQESLDRITVRVVPASGFGPEVSREIADRVRQRVGDVAVTVQEIPMIPRGPNGKFRAVVSRIPSAEPPRISSQRRYA